MISAALKNRVGKVLVIQNRESMCPMMTSIDGGTEHQIWDSLVRRWPYATYCGFGQSLGDHTVPQSLRWFPYLEVFAKCDVALGQRCGLG